jgi:trk system potassium uptake protein TrkA
MQPHQYIIIVGCGRLGSMLANQLSSLGSSVVVIDREETAFGYLSTEFSGFLVTGDAAELDVLRRARIDRADCLLAITQHDNVNLMVAGIETICPTTLSAEALLNALGNQPEAKQS